MNKHGLYGIYDVWHKPFWQTTAFYALAIVGIVCLVVVSIWYIVRRYYAKKSTLSAWDNALLELEAIKKSNIVGESRYKEFYFRLTWILKKYLNARYGFDVYGKTDEEVVNYLKKTDFPREQLDAIKVILTGGLMVKFANISALRGQMEQDLSSSIAIIKDTIPRS